MSNAGNHKENDFTPVVAAMELYSYVIKVTDNLNKFPDYSIIEQVSASGEPIHVVVVRSDSLTNVIRAEARDIYHYAERANRIDLRKEPWRAHERLHNQELAIDVCDDMFRDLQLCQHHFHISTKRMLYWGSMIKVAKDSISRWHAKEAERLKQSC